MQIKTTRDYSLFQTQTGNRKISQSHVRDFIKLIQDGKFLPTPIIVNEKFEIIDGQHRFIALRETNQLVYYVVVDKSNLQTTIDLNRNSKNWVPMDYISSYAEQGNLDYKVLLDACVQNKKVQPVYIGLILDGKTDYNSHYSDTIIKGEFRISSDADKLNQVLNFYHNKIKNKPDFELVKKKYRHVVFYFLYVMMVFKFNDAPMKYYDNFIKNLVNLDAKIVKNLKKYEVEQTALKHGIIESCRIAGSTWSKFEEIYIRAVKRKQTSLITPKHTVIKPTVDDIVNHLKGKCNQKLFSVKDTAEIVKKNKGFIYAEIRDGKLKFVERDNLTGMPSRTPVKMIKIEDLAQYCYDNNLTI